VTLVETLLRLVKLLSLNGGISLDGGDAGEVLWNLLNMPRNKKSIALINAEYIVHVTPYSDTPLFD